MTRMTKTLLVLSLICLIAGLVFVTGLVNVARATGLYAVFPAGAILFGLFLISRILEREATEYDHEQRIIAANVTALTAEKSSAVPAAPAAEPIAKPRSG